MRFSTPTLAKTALVVAALAGASTASAEPIRILNAAAQPPAAAPASDCAAAPADAGADIECVLSLTPPQPGAEPTAPRRIVIRAQWAPQRCATRGAQVVDMTRPAARARAVPIVDQAGSGRACVS
jgi:hypothetical protein